MQPTEEQLLDAIARDDGAVHGTMQMGKLTIRRYPQPPPLERYEAWADLMATLSGELDPSELQELAEAACARIDAMCRT